MPFFKPTTQLFDTQLDQLSMRMVAASEAVQTALHNPDQAAAIAKIVGDHEHAADRVVRETVKLAPNSLGSADRADLLNLVEAVDDIIDVTDGMAQRIWLHQVGAATPEAQRMLQTYMASVRCVQRLVATLRTMGDASRVLDLCMELDRLEDQGDEQHRTAMLDLFSGNHDALHVMRWKDVYERLESAINKCEDVGRAVQALVQAIA